MLDQDSELGSQLEDWFNEEVEPLGHVDEIDKRTINLAGADVYQKKLRDVTRDKHYSHFHDDVYGHMADGIATAFGTEGKAQEVSTDLGGVYVGWENHFHAMNAMRLNDGTKSRPGDHFKTNIDNDQVTIDEVLSAEKKAYKERMSHKGIHVDDH